ncbi:MAG: hypothetical protein KKB31_07785 [Nanoarchaeota archaeon]|nr:hypothetical protein [Nanoarchaeota archaeon]
MTFERIVTMAPAFDRRNQDPSRNYGIQGVDLRMVLKGPDGVVQFLLYTNWMLPHVQDEMDSKPLDTRFPYVFHKPLPADVGYHSKVPRYEGHEPAHDYQCPYTDGVCYRDGSVLAAKDMYRVLCERGSDGVWEELESYYHKIFADTEAARQR